VVGVVVGIVVAVLSVAVGGAGRDVIPELAPAAITATAPVIAAAAAANQPVTRRT